MADLQVSGSVHFVGIGGVGMSGLANILLDLGESVTGSDAAVTFATRRLRARGAGVRQGHDPDNVPENAAVVVYSSAVPEDNPELVAARRRGIRTSRRGHFLAELATRFPCVIAVAGSHGKTTTTAMIAHILRACGRRPGFLVGGEVAGWPVSASAGDGRILVTEVDESDGTQDALASSLAVITNIEDDHCWSVGGEAALRTCFADFAGRAQAVLAWDAAQPRELLGGLPEVTFLDDAAIPAALALPVPGEYNRRNATLAVAAAGRMGVSTEDALEALRSFPGVKRRLTCHYRSHDESTVLVEDYAHHPTELRCLLAALRARYPKHRLVTIFQPHRFERVKRYSAEFAAILSTADEVVVTAPFAAWLEDGEQIRPEAIAEGISGPSAQYWRGEYPPLVDRLLDSAFGGDRSNPGPVVFAVIGAGSIARLIPSLHAALVRRELCEVRNALAERSPGLAFCDETPWWELTTLGIGGVRPLVARPRSMEQLGSVLGVARDFGVQPLVLGRGSNLIGTDFPARVVVIRLEGEAFGGLRVEGGRVTAGAGLGLKRFCHSLLHEAALPPDWAPLGWIPGSLGGAARMNAGAEGVCMGDVVTRLKGVRFDGTPWEADAAGIHWEYRRTDIPADVVLCQIECQLPAETDPDEARRRYGESGENRRRMHPAEPSAGCVFRNPGDAPAGRLIDRCGCKGWRETGCRVSEIHANYLVRDGEVLESQFMDLLLRVRFAVFERTGILLHPEVRFVNPDSQRLVEESIPRPRVVVLKGGPSAERSISLKSGSAVAGALRDAGMNVEEVDVPEAALPALSRGVDGVVPMLHGTFGEDGQLQQLLDQAGVAYVGTGAAASALMMDKARTKEVLREHGLRTPRACTVNRRGLPAPDLRYPIVVKPCSQGSSVGMTRLDQRDDAAWDQAVQAALEADTTVLAEEFVAGVDLTVGLLDGEPLPAVEIRPPGGGLYDFDAKYEYVRGHTEYFCPPEGVSEEAVNDAVRMAVEAYRVLGARHLLRVDFRVDSGGQPWILEANTIPGFTSTSLLPKAAKQAGVSFTELCARLVRAALLG